MIVIRCRNCKSLRLKIWRNAYGQVLALCEDCGLLFEPRPRWDWIEIDEIK